MVKKKEDAQDIIKTRFKLIRFKASLMVLRLLDQSLDFANIIFWLSFKDILIKF